MKKRAVQSKPADTLLRVAFVGWYTKENWLAVKAGAVDPERFELTYEDWLEMASNALSNLLAEGILGKPFYINAPELFSWCQSNNKANDAASRAQFVSESANKA